MSNPMLYAVAVLIWGSTWLAIKFQLGTVAPAVSIVWRFASAAALLFLYAAWRREPLAAGARTVRAHGWLALQGMLLFGINYVAVYVSEQTLSSGLAAVVFSFVVFFNLFGERLCFQRPLVPSALAGAVVGVTGVIAVFSGQLGAGAGAPDALTGMGYALGSALVASLGSLVAARNSAAGVPVVQGTAWSMLYGAAGVGLWAAARGERFVIEPSGAYLGSLVYLSLFGSVVAFTAYLTLVKRIGPGRAGYSSVAIPVVALAFSTLFESLHWRPLMVLGVVLCGVGNVLVLGSRRAAAAGPAAGSD